MSLAGYFELIEIGCGTILRKQLEGTVGSLAHEALLASGLVRPGRLARTLPCDKGAGRCSREAPILGPAPPLGANRERLAICSGECDDGDPCPPVVVTADDLAQELLATPDLVRLLHALYALEGSLPALTSSEPPAAPLLLGREAGQEGGREVFLALRPGAAGFEPFLAAREKLRERTLVLVPTARRISTERRARYANGSDVEIEVLSNSLVPSEKGLIRGPRLRVVGPGRPERSHQDEGGAAPVPPNGQREQEASSGPTSGIAAEIGAKSWGEITITVLDGHTVRINCGKASVRRTYLELGFAGARREPTEKWKVLLALCAGHGSFSWRRFGSYKTAKNAVSVVRTRLKAAFGLESDPFHRYSPKEGWRVCFFARSEIADDDG